MKLVDYQSGADNWKDAADRMENLIDQAIRARQALAIEIHMPVTMLGSTVVLKAEIMGCKPYKYELVNE